MKNVMILVILLCVAVVSNTAFGTATMTYTSADVGGGLTAYTFTVSRDTAAASFSTSNLVFTADGGTAFNQSLVNGAIDVEDLSGANSWDGTLGYVKAVDTWYNDGDWAETAPNASSFTGTTSIVLNNLGTFAGSENAHTSVLLIQIVADGNFSWTGGIAADASIYDVGGAVPEPLTMSLLAIGGLLVVARRKRS